MLYVTGFHVTWLPYTQNKTLEMDCWLCTLSFCTLEEWQVCFFVNPKMDNWHHSVATALMEWCVMN